MSFDHDSRLFEPVSHQVLVLEPDLRVHGVIERVMVGAGEAVALMSCYPYGVEPVDQQSMTDFMLLSDPSIPPLVFRIAVSKAMFRMIALYPA